MTSVGNSLRQKRESDGILAEEIAGRLCITVSYVHALEADDVSSLPGAFFYKSFALQYAQLLGLDTAPLRENIASAEAPALERVPRIEPTLQIASRTAFKRSRTALGFGIAIAVCAAIIFAAAKLSFRRPTPLAPEAVVTVEQADTSFQVTKAFTDTPQTAVLSVAAREVTWLSITSEGREIFEGILWPSQSKTLTGLDMARMKVGNAGGLDVSWNGKPVGPIGETGEVRVVLFSADDVQVLPPSRSL